MNICYKYTHMYTHICTYKKSEYINIYIHTYIIRKAYIYIYIYIYKHGNDVPSSRLLHQGFVTTYALGHLIYNVCRRSIMTI